jgi:cytochrome P450
MTETKNDSLSLSSLLDPRVKANPYPLYQRLRTEDPVHWDEPMGFWVLTRYADIEEALRDPRLCKGRGITAALNRVPEEEKEIAEPVFGVFSKQMLYADPPYHTRLRGLVNKVFTPRIVAQMETHIQRIVDDLLDAVQSRGRMDIIGDLAYPLPFTVIMELLGLPIEERDRFKKWSDDFMATLGVVRQNPEIYATAAQSLEEFTVYICEIRGDLVENPRDDLLSALATVAEEGDRLDNAELVANSAVLLGAGHETTTHLIGNGLLALMRHPDQMEKLKADPSFVATAIEEFLRLDSPAQIVWRYAAENVRIGGKEILEGQFMNLMVGAANRDPEQFPNPDQLDIEREDNRHLGFGKGIHFCPGAALARLEGTIAIRTVLRRMPDLKLETEELDWETSPTFRGVKSLPVSF